MHATKIQKTVKNGTVSIDIPKEFGDTVEIIILPVNSTGKKEKTFTGKTIPDIAGKAKISDNIFTELENGRREERSY